MHAGEDLGLHGPHSNSPAELLSVVQPDPHAGLDPADIQMSWDEYDRKYLHK